MLLNVFKLDKKLRLQYKTLLNIKDKIENSKNSQEIEALSKLGFNSLKDSVYDYYNPVNQSMHSDYALLLEIMQKIVYPKIYLFPINMLSCPNGDMDHETKLLTNIVNKVRSELTMPECANAKSLSLNELDFSILENSIKFKVLGILRYLRINYQILEINTGFLDSNILNPEINPHYAFILNMNNKYLLDIAYPRYFSLKNNFIDALGVVGYDPVNVGFYMINNPQRKEFAYSLLNKGFIKITPENLKYYGDGFALSFRNGLYYDQLKDLNFQTTYSAQDYLRFFNGEDNQVNYEKKLVLGRQRIPVANKDLFKF